MPYIGKQLSNGNYLKLDDISSSFNGSTTTFSLTNGGSAYYPGSELSILVSVGGVIQEPESAYQINNDEITFANAPTAQDSFFCVVLGDALGIGVPGNNTVNGAQMAKPFNYDGGLLYLNDTDNRVGINSTSPQAALDVVGDLNVSGNISGIGGTLGGTLVGNVYASSGISTFNDLLINGDLTVQGDTTTLNTTLRNVELLRVSAASTLPAGIVTQTGTGDILSLRDNTTEVFKVADGGAATFAGAIDANSSIDVAGTSTLNDDVTLVGAASSNVTWDKSANLLKFDDHVIAGFGDSSDLKIWHDANHSYIRDTGAGYLRIQAADYLQLGTASTPGAFLNCESTSGTVYIAHNGNDKIQTTSTGVNITGICTATDFSGASGGAADFPNGLTGTTGIFSGELTIPTWIVHAGDSNTKFGFDGPDVITATTGGAERLRISSTGQVSISSDGTTDGLLTIKGDSDQVGTPSIRLLDGSDTREVSITNTSGDFVASVHGNDNAIHGHIKMFESGILDINNGGASGTNTNRVRIATDGKIGISTVAITHQLHTFGAGNTGGARFENSHTTTTVSGNTASTAFPHNILLSNYQGGGHANNRMASIGFDIPTVSSHANATIAYQAEDASGNGSLQFWLEEDNTSREALRITSHGKVVIRSQGATGSDGYAGLEIRQNTGGKHLVLATNSATSSTNEVMLGFKLHPSGQDERVKGAIICRGTGSSDYGQPSRMSFCLDSVADNGNATIANDEKVCILSSGRVGIKNNLAETFWGNANTLCIGDGGGAVGLTFFTAGAADGSHIAFQESTGSSPEGLISYYQGGYSVANDRDNMIFKTTASEKIRITGAGRLIIEGNNATSRAVWGVHSYLQVNGTGWDDSSICLNNFAADTTRATLNFMKSRNATIGNYSTVPANGESMGAISWSPADGADANMSACRIEGLVAGTVDTSNAPGEIRFYTNAGSTGSDPMVFNRLGRLGIGVDAPEATLHPRANASHGTDTAFQVGAQSSARYFQLNELSNQDNFSNCVMSFYDNSLREILTLQNTYAALANMGMGIVFRGHGGGQTGSIRAYNPTVNTTSDSILHLTASNNNNGIKIQSAYTQVLGTFQVNAFQVRDAGFSSTWDTGISVNGGSAGASMIFMCSRNWDAGNSTGAGLYFVRLAYDGNNSPDVDFVSGDNSWTIGKSGSNTITINGGSGNQHVCILWTT